MQTLQCTPKTHHPNSGTPTALCFCSASAPVFGDHFPHQSRSTHAHSLAWGSWHRPTMTSGLLSPCVPAPPDPSPWRRLLSVFNLLHYSLVTVWVSHPQETMVKANVLCFKNLLKKKGDFSFSERVQLTPFCAFLPPQQLLTRWTLWKMLWRPSRRQHGLWLTTLPWGTGLGPPQRPSVSPRGSR